MLRGSPGAGGPRRTRRLNRRRAPERPDPLGRAASALCSSSTNSAEGLVELVPVALDGLRHPLRGGPAGKELLVLVLQCRVHGGRGPVGVAQGPVVVGDGLRRLVVGGP